jgi:hypothetical protein
VLSPWAEPDEPGLLNRISNSRTVSELEEATADPVYDYTPPTDARPYYFNMLKPQAYFNDSAVPRTGALGGNLRATLLLLVLLGVASALVLMIVLWPLVRSGLPEMALGRFAWTMAYFATIGFAYMLIQIGLLQRFSTYLGHPTYTLAIVLCSMLLFTGLGSLLSERAFGAGGRVRLLPVAIASALVVTALVLPPILHASVAAALAVRTAWVLAFTGGLATLLGMCFPVGVRLIGDHRSVVAWAWGVNGACGVLASILAVGLSIWVGIDTNFWVAAVLYAGLLLPLAFMGRRSPARA